MDTPAGFDGAYYIYKNLAIGASFTFQDQGEFVTKQPISEIQTTLGIALKF